jgi:hypothetical protein
MLSRAEYLNWLNQVPNAGSAPDQALLNAAKSVASDQVLAAEIQLGKSQSKLMDFLPQRAPQVGFSDLLPLPADQPLIQKYKTNYDLYQSRQMIPHRLRGVDAMLPKTLELICDRAKTIQLAKSAAEATRHALENRQSNVASLLEAGRLWRSAEQDLIASVTSYNQAIADYSLAIAGGGHSPEQIVAMLIAKPQSPSASSPIQEMASDPPFGNPQFNHSINTPSSQNGIARPSQPSPLRQAIGAEGQNRLGGSNAGQFGSTAGQNTASHPPENFRSPNQGVTESQFSNEEFQNNPPPRSANSQFGPVNNNQFGR